MPHLLDRGRLGETKYNGKVRSGRWGRNVPSVPCARSQVLACCAAEHFHGSAGRAHRSCETLRKVIRAQCIDV